MDKEEIKKEIKKIMELSWYGLHEQAYNLLGKLLEKL